MSAEQNMSDFVAKSLIKFDEPLIESFINGGAIPGGVEGANRYLLAMALRDISPEKLATITSISLPLAEHLTKWLDAGTRS